MSDPKDPAMSGNATGSGGLPDEVRPRDVPDQVPPRDKPDGVPPSDKADGVPDASHAASPQAVSPSPSQTPGKPDPGDAATARSDDAKADDAESADGKADDGKADDGKADDGKADDGKADDGKADGGEADGGKVGGGEARGGEAHDPKRDRRRSVVTTALSIFAVLLVVTAFGYFGGIGPLARLSTMRSLHAPDTLSGLSRITDQQTRTRLELDQAADALAQNNEGETAVEAYGDVASGTGLFVVIALRGKIDVDRTVADAGPTADQVQKVGESTCTTQPDQVVTCYRTSNTLTVMVRNSTGKAAIDRVAPMTDEAFRAFK